MDWIQLALNRTVVSGSFEHYNETSSSWLDERLCSSDERLFHVLNVFSEREQKFDVRYVNAD